MSRAPRQPYPGLRAFERSEARIFFGRQQQVDELLARLKEHHFLAVLGASGSGKSSLVKAGLLAGLEKGYMGEVGSRWAIAEMRPGEQPFVRLAAGLSEVLPSPLAGGEAPRSSGREGLGKGGNTDSTPHPSLPPQGGKGQKREAGENTATLAAALRRGARSLREILAQSPLPAGTRLLILVDQFEEVFRFRSQAAHQAAAFVALLLEACTHPDVYVVITMRSDFLGDAAEFHGLPEAINSGLYLTPRLTRAQLREAICFPAQLFGGQVEAALVNQLLNEAGSDPDQLPLLQHALMVLFQHDPQMRLATYQALDGLRGTLHQQAEQAFATLDKEAQAVAALMFRALTEYGQEGQAIRRPVTVQAILDLSGVDLATLTPIVDTFRQAGRHFLMPPPEVPLSAETVLDISHESLIRQWGRLQDWVAAEHEQAALYLRLLEAVERYDGERGELWRGLDLALAQHWQADAQVNAQWAERYSEPEQFTQVLAFIEKSAEQQTLEQRKLESLYQQRTELLFDSNLTHASLLAKIEDFAAAKAKLASTCELDTAIAAPRRHARDLLAGYSAIMGGAAQATFQDGDKPLPQLAGHVAISPDGQWLAASGERGTLALFKRASGELVQRLQGHDASAGSTGSVRDIVFHPKQPWLFSAGDDGEIIQWHLPQAGQVAQRLRQWSVEAGGVKALALTPDGTVLASGHEDGGIRLWDVAEELEGAPQRLRVLTGHEQMIASFGLAFSPDGERLASASYDHTVRLWDWQEGQSEQVLRGNNDDVLGVAFSADGEILASASADQSIILWDVATGQGLRRLTGHQNMVFDLQFLPNGLLASAGFDNTIRLWDGASGVTRRILQGHTAGIGGLARWPEAGLLYSASNDGTVKRWSGEPARQWLLDLPDAGTSSAISPDGRFMVVGLKDGAIQVYTLDNEVPPQLQQIIQAAHYTWVLRLVFNSDGSLLASGSHDDKAKIWKVDVNGELTLKQTIEEHTNSVYAVAFSPDNTQLATASYNGRIGLFDLAGEKPPQLFAAHEGRVASVSFDESSQQLLSAGIQDFALKRWDLSTQPPTADTLATANDKLLWASLSPDGQQVASVGREHTVSVYPSSGTGEPLPLHGHEQTVHKAIFSPDSRQLATASGDMTVRLWDLDTRSELFRLRLPITFSMPSPLWDFDFHCTPTGCWIAVPLTAGKLALYNLGRVDYAE